VTLSPEDKRVIREENEDGRVAWGWFADQIPSRLTYHNPGAIYHRVLGIIETAPRDATVHLLDLIWVDFYLCCRYHRPICWKPSGPWSVSQEWEGLRAEATGTFGWFYREFDFNHCPPDSSPGFSGLVPWLKPLVVQRRKQAAYRLTSFARADLFARQRGARLTWSRERRTQSGAVADGTSR
jgi:hypothetical protein